jgi:hypothetical protein
MICHTRRTGKASAMPQRVSAEVVFGLAGIWESWHSIDEDWSECVRPAGVSR